MGSHGLGTLGSPGIERSTFFTCAINVGRFSGHPFKCFECSPLSLHPPRQYHASDDPDEGSGSWRNDVATGTNWNDVKRGPGSSCGGS